MTTMKAEKLINHDAKHSSNGHAAHSTVLAERPHLAGPHLPGPDDDPAVLPPRWYQLHWGSAAMVAKSGGDSSRLNISSSLLIGIVGILVTLFITGAGWGWSLAVQLTTAQQDIKQLKIDVNEGRAYTQQVRDEQVRQKTERDTLDKLNALKKGK